VNGALDDSELQLPWVPVQCIVPAAVLLRRTHLLVVVGSSGGRLQLVVVIRSSRGGGVDLVYCWCCSVFMDRSGGGDGCSRIALRQKWSRQALTTGSAERIGKLNSLVGIVSPELT